MQRSNLKTISRKKSYVVSASRFTGTPFRVHIDGGATYAAYVIEAYHHS